MMLLPAIDLINGRCVRLEQGDFARRTDYDADPIALACAYAEAGAKYLHLVDLDGARAGEPRQLSLIASIVKACGIPVQVGGGLRNAEQVEGALQTGVARVVVGSALVRDPECGREWLTRFGADRMVAALDARKAHGVFQLAVSGWQENAGMDLLESVTGFMRAGLRHALITDIDRDGLMQGPNVDLYSQLQARASGLQVQASGGVRSTNDLMELSDAGLSGAIVGKALLSGELGISDALGAVAGETQ